MHQFFPIDSNYLTKKFLDYWKPSIAIFIESEIWPNMLMNTKKRSIPLILLNARITKKSYDKWKKIPKMSKILFTELFFSSFSIKGIILNISPTLEP